MKEVIELKKISAELLVLVYGKFAATQRDKIACKFIFLFSRVFRYYRLTIVHVVFASEQGTKRCARAWASTESIRSPRRATATERQVWRVIMKNSASVV